MAIDVSDLIDLDNYPIHSPWSDDLRILLDKTKAQLSDDGSAVLR